jgi:hypothetical protein
MCVRFKDTQYRCQPLGYSVSRSSAGILSVRALREYGVKYLPWSTRWTSAFESPDKLRSLVSVDTSIKFA